MRRALVLLASLMTAAAEADETTQIVSGFDEGMPWLSLGVRYAYEARSAAIKREFSGLAGTGAAPGAVPIVKDLVFAQSSHTITPHIEVGVWHDLQLSIALPIVVSLSRKYEFDQRADPCVFPGAGVTATCIDRTNSSTMIDKLLPDGSMPGGLGYDAGDPSTNFATNSTTVFKSVDRHGLDQLQLGITWAPMNQDKDDTKPTWVIGAELRLSVGKIMKFNRLSPGNEDGVSRGVHEARLFTAVSRRINWAEPFVDFYWQAPIGVRGDKPGDPDGSLFWDAGFGQKTKHAQQEAGTTFGFDAIAYDKPALKQRVAIELTARIIAHFDGMNYSEMWEPFAYAGDVGSNPSAPLAIDLDPTRTDDTPINHPGVTTIENYLTFGGRLGVTGQIGPHVRFNVSFELGHDQTHAITFSEAGTEFPACNGSNGPNCETPDDNVITPGTREVNPLHKALIDQVGRRYLVDETTTYTFLVNGQFRF